MILGLISDIHGNLSALEAVLADMEENGAERVICLGDVVGYGPFPGECLDLVRRCGAVLMGNHEAEFMADPAASKVKEFADELKAAGIVPSRNSSGRTRTIAIFESPEEPIWSIINLPSLQVWRAREWIKCEAPDQRMREPYYKDSQSL